MYICGCVRMYTCLYILLYMYSCVRVRMDVISWCVGKSAQASLAMTCVLMYVDILSWCADEVLIAHGHICACLSVNIHSRRVGDGAQTSLLIPKGTGLPCECSVSLGLVDSAQTSALIQVFEGPAGAPQQDQGVAALLLEGIESGPLHVSLHIEVGVRSGCLCFGVCGCTDVCTLVNMHTCIDVCIFVLIYMYLYVCVYICVYTCIHMYVYTYR